MGKAEDNKSQKKQRLMDSAFKLFTSQGIKKTSISDITTHSGIAKGTFYLYFKDKYDLELKLIAHKSQIIFDYAVQNSDYQSKPTPEDKVIALTDCILGQLEADPLLLRFINKNLTSGILRKALSKEETNYVTVFRDIFSQEQNMDQLMIMAYLIIEMTSSTCHSVILDKYPVDFETFKPYLYESIRVLIRHYYPDDNTHPEYSGV